MLMLWFVSERNNMANLSGIIGEVSFKVSVTSKETGETKAYDMVGFVDEKQLKALQEEGLVKL